MPVPPPPPKGWEKVETTDDRHVVGDEVELSKEQLDAVDFLINEDFNLAILTGQAGAGKSTVANHMLRVHGAQICATTGKAAVGNGSHRTIDSLIGLNRKKWTWDAGIAEKNLGEHPSKIVEVDEGSMSGDMMTSCILEAATMFEKKVVLVGDWAQASPVMDGWITRCKGLDLTKNFVKLVECHRQSDSEFVSALNQVREGDGNSARKLFESRILVEPPNAPGWVRMFATNREADRFNVRACSDHCSKAGVEPFNLMAGWVDKRPDFLQREYPLTHQEVLKKVDEFRLSNREMLTVGAQVIMTANAPYDEQSGTRTYVNGDVGIIYDVERVTRTSGDPDLCVPSESVYSLWSEDKFDLDDLRSKDIGALHIQLDRGPKIRISRCFQEIKDMKGRVKYKIHGFPVKLGYAFTIHKAQGMTVDKAWVDIKSIRNMPEDGRHGLAYVGVSRSRTLSGLYVSSWDPSLVVCDEEIRCLI